MNELQIRDVCARICENMVIVGRQQTREQKIVARALYEAADNIRNDEIYDEIEKEVLKDEFIP